MKFNVKTAITGRPPEAKKKDQFDPDITVPGMGIVKMSRCKAKINNLLEDYVELALGERYRNIDALLNGKILATYVKAVADYERQLEKAAN
jgi:hypothetical protein